MIESDVAALLLAEPSITALTGTRITPGYLAHEGAFPAIAIRRAAGVPSYTFSGDVVESTTLDIICWGGNWSVARQLAELVRARLHKYSGGNIEIIRVADGADIPAPDTGEYGCVLVATVDHGEA